MHEVTATAEWQPSARAGQVHALLALLFAPEPVTEADPAEDAA